MPSTYSRIPYDNRLDIVKVRYLHHKPFKVPVQDAHAEQRESPQQARANAMPHPPWFLVTIQRDMELHVPGPSLTSIVSILRTRFTYR